MLLSFSFSSKGNLSSSLQSIWSRVVTRQVGNGCLKPSDQIDLIFIIRYNMKDRINLKMKELKQSLFHDKQSSLEVILVSVDFDFAEQYHKPELHCS